MNKPKITPKDFFVWMGAVITFYWSVIAFILLIFNYINYTFPNTLIRYPVDPYQSGISYEMASIIILLPLYIVIMRVIHNDILRDATRKEIWVRRWALLLTLFLTGVVMVIDLITLLTIYLNGEDMTISFLLKVAVIFLVAIGIFIHFIADLRGYWDSFPKRKQVVMVSVILLAIATIVSGFFIVGTPKHSRLLRYDAQKVSDLQAIQSQVVYYWQAKQKLPEIITDINKTSFYNRGVQSDPQTGNKYTYKITGASSFKLCATFNLQGNTNIGYSKITVPPTINNKKIIGDNWYHSKGKVCFSRTIDPSLYPPLK